MSIEKLGAIWPEWKVVKQLGEGSFGKVYEVVRNEHGVTSTAAVKVISIPQSDAELSSIRAEGLDETGTRSYFEGIVTDFVNEIKLMQSMKGTSNIVSVEDYQVLEKTDKIGWDIFIRMELLTPLNDYTADKTLTEAEVIKLGQDVCVALELCARRNIIHRDIKPENIFVSSFGDFKVGDFGIARELEKTSGSLSQKGTYNYMAPEITTSKHYDATVDLYSLGLVLYKLLNNNRLPFLNPHAQLIQYQDRKNAIDRRFSGEVLPAPINASPHLAQIILAACAFVPAKRFKTPTALKNALGAVKGEKPTPVPAKPAVQSDINAATAVRHAPQAAQPTPVPARPAVQSDINATMAVHRAPQAAQPTPVPARPAVQSDLNTTMAVRRAPQAAQPIVQQYTQQREVPVAALGNEKKKKSKGKKVFAALLVLIIVAVIGAGVFILNPGDVLDNIPNIPIIGDSSADVITALEDGNFNEAIALAADADSDSLRRRLEDRLDTLESDFRAENAGFDEVSMELDAIGRMNVSGLSGRLNSTRESVTGLNASRIAFASAETLSAQGSYAEAIAQYRLVIHDDPNFERAAQGLDRAADTFRNDALAQANTLVAEGNHNGAITLLNSALQTLPNDVQLASRRDAISDARPISLSTVVVVDSRHYSHSEDLFIDSFGNHHHESFRFDPVINSNLYNYNREFSDSDRTAYAVFNLNRGFTTFSADIVAPEGLYSYAEFLVEITFDENIIPVTYVSGFNVRTGSRFIQTDVSGVTTMTITIRTRDNSGRTWNQHQNIRLVNAELSR